VDIWTIVLKVLLLSVAIFIVAKILPKVAIKNFGTAIAVAVVLSILYYGILWLVGRLPAAINILTNIFTLGLFNFIIFAFLLWLIDQLMESIEIKGLETALLAAFLIAVINTLLNWIVF
jgi:putative membrane protein